jgi:hypothetical protein
MQTERDYRDLNTDAVVRLDCEHEVDEDSLQ